MCYQIPQKITKTKDCVNIQYKTKTIHINIKGK